MSQSLLAVLALQHNRTTDLGKKARRTGRWRSAGPRPRRHCPTPAAVRWWRAATQCPAAAPTRSSAVHKQELVGRKPWWYAVQQCRVIQLCACCEAKEVLALADACASGAACMRGCTPDLQVVSYVRQLRTRLWPNSIRQLQSPTAVTPAHWHRARPAGPGRRAAAPRPPPPRAALVLRRACG